MLGVAIKVPSIKTSHVPAGLHLASKMVASTPDFWKALGNLESSTLAKDMGGRTISKPIFVSGVARSGSTILTEVISQHPQMACHHYSDFPVTWIPYWWNSLRKHLPLPQQEPQERAHRDRLMITSDSPEAVEEVLWMHFFPAAHKPDRSHVMGAQESHPQFEKYYRDHIRKLLLVKDRQRYLAKNNYHATRLEYLLQLFPDARFIIPVRDPVQQVASLIKQHRLFSQQNAEDSRVSRQLQLSGHYEFGPLRCPIIVNETRQTHYGQDLEDVAWYANQWADVYGFLQQRMKDNPELAKACLVIPYEEICSRTEKSLEKIFAHVGLDDECAEKLIAAYAPIISAPDYYQHGFTAAQKELIRKLTSDAIDY
jgi:sulfotransferase family protein